MIVTDIIEVKNKYKVCIEGEFKFALYKNEIKKYHIKKDHEIEDALYKEVYEVVKKRGITYCGHLLAKRDYSISQIQQKLYKSDYSKEIIDEIILVLGKYDYINDYRYVKLFYHDKVKKYSHRVIRQKLIEKGIAKDIIDECIIFDEENEKKSLNDLIRKKTKNIKRLDESSRNKLIRYLLYKGYLYQDINSMLSRFIEEEYN